MNQILVSEALYITPEMKKKKRIYKINFFIALILMVILFSYYAFAEYNKYKEEEHAKQVLSSLDFSMDDSKDPNIKITEDQTVVLLDKSNGMDDEYEDKRTPEEEAAYQKAKEETTKIAESGDKYYTIGVVEIPSIDVKYAIINKTTDELLRISPTKFWGPDPNKIGNFCIVGHNYRNKRFFSKVPTLKNGDIIQITDPTGRKIDYAIYDSYVVEPENVSATSQKTDGKREVTRITCTNDSQKRVIVKAREVER